MKTSTLSNLPTFTPAGAGSGTLNFATAVASNGFAFGRLFAVINLTQNVLIYAASASGLGGTWNSGTSVLTLATSTTGHNSADVLEVIWDDPKASVSIDAPLIPQGWPNAQRFLTTGTVLATNLKSTSGTLGAVSLEPSAGIAGVVFLKIYDKSSAPVAGDTPKLVLFLCSSPLAQKSVLAPPAGIKFTNGIGIAVVTTSSDATLVNPGSDYCIVNIAWS